MSPRTIYLNKLFGLYRVLIAQAMISHKQTTVHAVIPLVHDTKVASISRS